MPDAPTAHTAPPAPTAAQTPPRAPGQRWSGRSLGGSWLFLGGAWLLRYVGISGSIVGSYVIAAGFMLTGGRTQYGAVAYWKRLRPGSGPVLRGMLILRHFASFGRVLCDRLLVYLRPEAFRFTYAGGERLRQAVQAPGGCVLLAAHLGNWELSGYRLRRIAKGTVHLVMVRGDQPNVQRFSDERMRGEGVSVIDPRDPLGASLAIHGALARGETVCMLGDRIYGSQATACAEFLGRPARFPVGPFHAAAITGSPILVCFLVKVGWRGYRLEVDEPWHLTLPPRGAARTAALQAAVQRWADRLERQVRRYPLQWHNFFDFWA